MWARPPRGHAEVVTLLATAPRPATIPARPLPRPSLARDVFLASRRLKRLAAAIPGSTTHYAVEGDPHPDLLTNLVAAGGSFSVETPAKLHACLAAGARPETLLLGHLVVPQGTPDRSAVFADCVELAARLGVRRFVVESDEGCRTVVQHAPGSSVVCRVGGPDRGQRGPSPDRAVSVLLGAVRLGLDPAGVTVHVGTRRHDPRAWRTPIAMAGAIYSVLRRAGHRPWLLGLGGGLPAAHQGGAPPLSVFAATIDRALRQEFGTGRPRTLVELSPAGGETEAWV
jgi:ornithine decarboxylase